jgi:glycosyltransferase involved in cell wall biosynthesis
MSSKPLVSCIIIFFNAEKFFEEAIESVFSQNYENWELLLTDDGSTDGSSAIALRYAQKYPDRVRYLEHENHQNRGMSATRNLGIRNAKGKYIAFLDSDDVWLPHKLEQQVAIMESQPEAAMVYGSSQYWYSWTGKPEDSQLDWVAQPTLKFNTLIEPPTVLTSCILVPEHKTATPPPSDIFLRREAVEHIGGFEESFQGIYQMFEDQAFFTKLYLHEYIFVASECWDKYRVHPDSCCSVVTKAGNFETARLFFLNWAEQYFYSQKVQNPKIWRQFRQKLWLHHHPFWCSLLKNTDNGVRWIKELAKLMVRRTLPEPIYQWLQSKLSEPEYITPVIK